MRVGPVAPFVMAAAVAAVAATVGAGGCAGAWVGSGGGGHGIGEREGDGQRGVVGDSRADATVRAAALVGLLTLDEEVAQLENAAPAIPRLGIPAYDWWSEALHGVARSGVATVFPQAIGLAATFDEDLVRRVGTAIADEARAKFEIGRGRERGTRRYQGLTFFAPNVNIFRDPRWGRGQETYGEDPLLTARMGVAYVRGLQGDDPRHLKVAAVGKHFAVHSGPELERHRFDARVEAHDLVDTYLPQFEALVRDAHVSGIMAAYNRVNGEPCVASETLLGETLRKGWGFEGFVVGDCGAVGDVVTGHRAATDDMHAAALALRAGTDLDCGRSYRNLVAAVGAGLVAKAEIDRALIRLFAVRFRLGLFDPTVLAGDAHAAASSPSPSPSASPSASPAAAGQFVPPAAHRALAREAAQKSLVLLENDGALPIAAGVRRLAVVGPVADDVDVLVGNYHGTPIAPVTVLAGIRAAAAARGIAVDYVPGVSLTGRSGAGLAEAMSIARGADVVIAVLGLSPRLEGEEGDRDGINPAGDRRDLNLPGAQPALLGALLGVGRPTVVVLTGGSAITLPPTAQHPAAVVMAWYSGEEGGNAVADVLFGDVAPSGHLPITFYRSVTDLPPFADYRMVGRTYRYFEGKPRFAFGHGLGYPAVAYGPLTVHAPMTGGVNAAAGMTEAPVSSPLRPPIVVSATVENRGQRTVDEVVQIYAAPQPRVPGDPLRALVAFRRVSLKPGQLRSVEIELPASAFSLVDSKGKRALRAGTWTLSTSAATATATVQIAR